MRSAITLFCHFPVFLMIRNFRSHGIVNALRWDSRILTPIAPSGISTGKKWRDRLSYLRFGIQKIQGFSETDRRGIIASDRRSCSVIAELVGWVLLPQPNMIFSVFLWICWVEFRLTQPTFYFLNLDIYPCRFKICSYSS